MEINNKMTDSRLEVGVDNETPTHKDVEEKTTALLMLKNQNKYITREICRLIVGSSAGIYTSTALKNEEILKRIEIEQAKNAYFKKAYPELLKLRITIDSIRKEVSL